MTDGRRQADAAESLIDGRTPGGAVSRRRVRVLCAVGLAWLGGVAAWYYVGTLIAVWTSITR